MSRIRNGYYSVERILKLISANAEFVTLDGDEIRIQSLKYPMFLEKGIDCVSCGMIGMYFVKEYDYHPINGRKTDTYLSLYGLDSDGCEVLITKDHIQPRSRGGADAVENLQPMCSRCNHGKGNKYGQEDEQYLDGRANFPPSEK